MSSTSSSVVALLNQDILAYIFHLNTYTREIEVGSCYSFNRPPSALQTALHTSQVCRLWRQLILQSSAIWGNVIDLEVLTGANEDWSDEIMERTGEASLSIYVPVRRLYTMRFLASMLDADWHRVRRLDIIIIESEKLYEVDHMLLWSVFWTRQAPNLENFIVDMDVGKVYDVETWEGFELFAGSAPVLCRMHSPRFHFDHRASWINQLLSVTLSGPLKVTDTLNVIARTPWLESLIFEPTVEYDSSTATWEENIHLPNLRRIEISSDIGRSYIYLSHITPRDDCALILAMRERPSDLQDLGTLERLSKIVLRYAENYFGSHYPTELAITAEDRWIEMSFDPNDEARHFGHPKFKVSLRSWSLGQAFGPEVVDILLSTMVPDSLKTVHNFRFTLDDQPLWYPTTDKSIQILQALTSVERMKLTPWAMHALNNLPADSGGSSSFFPALTRVTMDYHMWRKNFYKKVRTFLTQRRDAGIPVKRLYIPSDAGPRYEEDDVRMGHWSFLQEFEGLRVVFDYQKGDSDDEYECDGWVGCW